MIRHFTAIWQFRHFLMALIRLDLRLRYRRSVLGIGWSLLNPIAMTFVYCLVFSSLQGDAKWQTNAPFVLAGMVVWNFLRDSTLSGCKALIQNESYIRQAPLPYGLYSLRVVAGQAIHSMIAVAVVIALAAIFAPMGVGVFGMIPAAVPGLVLAFLAAWAVAAIMSFVNVYFQDTQHLLEIGAQLTFFLTPIIYRADLLRNKGLGWMVDLNPVTVYLDLVRLPLVDGVTPAATLYLQGVGLTAVFGGLAFGTAAWLQKRVIFHL